ncbi:ataxin-7-like protein 2 isoform X4 [Anser cygnoides]|uniref:ataxin-7-like protein 2 isoform X4 n=1 Tax=Anser cygnoides TaxID=8845 RepID=UPI0034D16CE9
MAARGRAAAAAMAAAERRLPSLDEFAGQSWSAWVERAGPPAEPAGLEPEESSKSGSKKLDAMTLIKEDMSIFGHCPAHDEFYLVVCNHCSQVVKPQAFQKHCGKECDLNRQCGVLNPDTKKICTRLLTCKIHSVHQRREVQGRAKDFDVLVAELKASSRRESPKEKSPVRKEPLPERPALAAPALPQPPAVPPSASPCRARPPHSHCPPPRARLSSDSDPEEGDAGLFPLPLPKGGSRGSSEESEEEGAEDAHRPDCHYAARPPRPQAEDPSGRRAPAPHRPGAPQPRRPPLRPRRPGPPAPHTDPPSPRRPPGQPGPCQHQLHGGVPARSGRLQPAGVRGGRQPVHHLPAAGQHPLALLQQVAFHQGQQILPGQGGGGQHGAGRRRPQTQAAPGRRRQPPLQTDLPRGRGEKQKPRLPGLAPPRQDESRPGVIVCHRCPQWLGVRRRPAEAGPPPGLPHPPQRHAGAPGLAAARGRGAPTAPPLHLRGRGQEAQEHGHVLPAWEAQARRPPASPPPRPRPSTPRPGLLRPQEEAGDPPGLRGEAERPEVQSPLTEGPGASVTARGFCAPGSPAPPPGSTEKPTRGEEPEGRRRRRKKKTSRKIPQDSLFLFRCCYPNPRGEEVAAAGGPGAGAAAGPPRGHHGATTGPPRWPGAAAGCGYL